MWGLASGCDRLLVLVTITESREVSRLRIRSADGGPVRSIAHPEVYLGEQVGFLDGCRTVVVRIGNDAVRIDLATGARRVVARRIAQVGAF